MGECRFGLLPIPFFFFFSKTQKIER